MIITKQMKTWQKEFGRDYTNRNALSLQEMESLYKKIHGFTRTEINSKFLAGLDRNMRILEVGSNIGNQLLYLKKAEFKNLYGIDCQAYAVEVSKSRTKGLNIIQGSRLSTFLSKMLSLTLYSPPRS